MLTDGVQFSATKFSEIIYSALIVNQPEWADDFIKQYSHELGPDVRENTVNYGRALCAFHVGKYDAAQDFLYAITVMNFSVRISIKILLIKIYYDKNELNFHNIDTHPINSELEALRQLTRPGSNTKSAFSIEKRKLLKKKPSIPTILKPSKSNSQRFNL